MILPYRQYIECIALVIHMFCVLLCFGVVRWNKFHPHRTLVLMLCFTFWRSYYHAKHTYVLYLVISHICVRYPLFSTMGFNLQYKPRWFQGFLAIWWRENEAHFGISYWPTENSFSHKISCLSWIKFSLKWTHIVKTLKTLWTRFEQESTKWTVRYCLTKKTFKVWLYIIISKVSVDLSSHCFTRYKMYNNECESRFNIHKRFSRIKH